MLLLQGLSKICKILSFPSHFFFYFCWCILIFFNSLHPYIFFNQDGVTMTFVGFHIDQNGNLIDPDSHVIIQPNLMSGHLRTGLFIQKVDMETNYESWSKYEIWHDICRLWSFCTKFLSTCFFVPWWTKVNALFLFNLGERKSRSFVEWWVLNGPMIRMIHTN